MRVRLLLLEEKEKECSISVFYEVCNHFYLDGAVRAFFQECHNSVTEHRLYFSFFQIIDSFH
jgi:hypothetical protein